MDVVNSLTKNQFYAVYIARVTGTPTILSHKRIKGNTETVAYGDKSFVIDIDRPTYQMGRKLFYFVDINEGHIPLGEGSIDIPLEMLDSLMSKNIVAQMISRLPGKSPISMDTIIILVVLGFGGCLGYIIGQMFPVG